MRNALVALLLVACGGADRAPLPQALALQDAKCKAGDAGVCTELMAELQDRSSLSDDYGWRACAFGASNVCEYMGSLLMTRALAPRGTEDADALLKASKPPLVQACEADSWLGCTRLAAVLQLTEAPAAEREPVAQKSYTLVKTSCDKGDAQACEFLAEWAAEAGDSAGRQAALTAACKSTLILVSVEDRQKQFPTIDACKAATEAGVSSTELQVSEPKKTFEGAALPAGVVEAKRLRGTTQIVPPDDVKRTLAAKKMSKLNSSWYVCLSKTGRVATVQQLKSSNAPAYDRLLVETMRKWQYTPFVVDGVPEKVCTAVTFLYTQHN